MILRICFVMIAQSTIGCGGNGRQKSGATRKQRLTRALPHDRMEAAVLSNKATTELEKKLKQAHDIMASIMEAGDSGTVTIGFGNGGLRIVYTRHERPVPVKAEKIHPAKSASVAK